MHSPVFIRDKVYCNAEMSVTSRSTDSMQVSLSMLREIKVNDHVHCLNVNASGEQIYKQRIYEKSR